MKNEKGITLIELLAAVVIAGIVIVPLLTIMTGTLTRTVSQEKETEIAYIAQEVMEKIRLYGPNTPSTSEPDYDHYFLEEKQYCLSNDDSIYELKGITCDALLPTMYHPSTSDVGNYYITANVTKYHPTKYPNFYKVKLTVFEDTRIITGGESSSILDKENSIEIITVVELP